VRDLYLTYVHVLLFVRKADAANGEADYSQKNKDDTNYGCRFHLGAFQAENLRLSTLCRLQGGVMQDVEVTDVLRASKRAT
jgi:hypothetical protein